MPSFQNHTVILVVVDRLTKVVHFDMLHTHFTTVKVVELFAHMICKLHGTHRSIISNKDYIFLSHFLQELL